MSLPYDEEKVMHVILCFRILTDCSEEKKKLGKLTRSENLFSIYVLSLEAEGNFSSFNVF